MIQDYLTEDELGIKCNLKSMRQIFRQLFYEIMVNHKIIPQFDTKGRITPVELQLMIRYFEPKATINK